MKSCKDCFHKCKAECCYWVPLNVDFVKSHEDKIQRPIYGTVADEGCAPGNEFFITHVEQREEVIDGKRQPVNAIDKQKQACPFLNPKTHRCAIYTERPNICRAYGTRFDETHPFTCHYHIGKDYHAPNLSREERMIRFMMHKDDIMKNYKRLMKEYQP